MLYTVLFGNYIVYGVTGKIKRGGTWKTLALMRCIFQANRMVGVDWIDLAQFKNS